jgi:putative ABC transport system substrate-binding protein
MAITSCARPAEKPQKPIRIGLVYVGPHRLINQIVDGFRDGVTKSMGTRPFDIIEKHANGNKATVSVPINAAISAGLDVIVAITTRAAEVTLKNAPSGLPVVFVGITDPVGAGLVKSLEQPVLSTGVIDQPPLVETLSLIKEIAPSVKRIGFPYSPDEQNALYSRRKVEELAPGLGFTIDARPASKDDLATIVQALARSNDAVLVGADNKMFDAAANISKIALDNRKPFFAADSTSVEAGAAAGVTVDYRQVGLEGAKLVARVLAGERVGRIPVAIVGDEARERLLELNRTTIKKLGLHLEDSVWSRAKTIFP